MAGNYVVDKDKQKIGTPTTAPTTPAPQGQSLTPGTGGTPTGISTPTSGSSNLGLSSKQSQMLNKAGGALGSLGGVFGGAIGNAFKQAGSTVQSQAPSVGADAGYNPNQGLNAASGSNTVQQRDNSIQAQANRQQGVTNMVNYAGQALSKIGSMFGNGAVGQSMQQLGNTVQQQAPVAGAGWNMAEQEQVFQEVNYNFANQVESLMGTLNDLKAQLAQDDGSQAMIAAWYADMEAGLDQAYQQMLQDMNSQMGSQDPAILAAIQALKEEVGLQRQAMYEELNARGLSQSGVLAEMDIRMRRGELTEIQQLTSARLSELKSAVMGAIQNFAGQRASLLQEAFNRRNDAMQAQLDRKANLTGQLLSTQASLTDTVGRWDQARMQVQSAREGFANARAVANIQGQYALRDRSMQNRGQLDNTRLQNQGQQTIEGMRIQGDKDITGMQIQGQKDIAGMQIGASRQELQMQIDAEAAKWSAQMANDVTLANIDAGSRERIARTQAENNLAIQEMAGRNEALALQMKAASDSVVNVILPLVASGQMDPQAFLDRISNQPPEVQQMYRPVLEAMAAGKQQTTGGVQGISTPTWSANPTVAADQKAAYRRSIQAKIAEDETKLSDLQAQLTKAEQNYTNSTGVQYTRGGMPGMPVAGLVDKQSWQNQIEYLTAEIEKVRQRIEANRQQLGQFSAPVTTPTRMTGNQP